MIKKYTRNYSDPDDYMLRDPLWNSIWNEIKTWDINVPEEYSGYSPATGNHATAIFKAILRSSENNYGNKNKKRI